MRNTKIIISAIALLLSSFQSYAIRAPKKALEYVQPDGKIIRINLHGDEFHHWATDQNGNVLSLDKNKFYRVSGTQIPLESEFSKHKRDSERKYKRPASRVNGMTSGNHRFLVILVEFADLYFTLDNPQEKFFNLLNEPGYSTNGGTGSAFDYYYENSYGQFNPTFDVYGPYRLSHGYSYYGENDAWGDDRNPDGGFYEACQLADSDVDFSQYDQDGDGYVDNVFFYYAGHNEAEGANANTIWPHKYGFYYYGGLFDGVRLNDYACTSEYKNSYGSNMCGIGTFCHEFCHVIGLPDFYDTDYNSNGYCDPLSDFSLMDNGSYNNDGRTPPYLSSIERNLLGWMGEPEVITKKGDFSLEPVHQCRAYAMNTENPGEYFLMETRDGSGWDKYIPQGMVIYHVDQSNNMVHGQTAKSRWNNWNGINCYSDHPCYYIWKAYDSPYYESQWLFPGSANVVTFRGRSWAGIDSDFSLNNIRYSAGNVSFTASSAVAKFITGYVRDLWGSPVSDAAIEVCTLTGACIMTAVTAADGSYTLDLSEREETEFILNVSHKDFISRSINVTVPRNTVTTDIIMYTEWDGTPETITKAGEYSGSGYGWGSKVSIMGAVRYSAEELGDRVGKNLISMSFIVSDSGANSVFAFVDVDGVRVINQEVLKVNYGGWTEVDLNQWNFKIPEGKEIMAGYAVVSPEEGRPLALDNGSWVEGGGYSARYYTAGTPMWSALKANLMVNINVSAVNNILRSEGFSFISKDASGDFVVVPGRSLSIKDVKWTVTSGSVTADVTYTDGSTETIEMEL